jgi:hypothetical protein
MRNASGGWQLAGLLLGCWLQRGGGVDATPPQTEPYTARAGGDNQEQSRTEGWGIRAPGKSGALRGSAVSNLRRPWGRERGRRNDLLIRCFVAAAARAGVPGRPKIFWGSDGRQSVGLLGRTGP